MPHTSVTLAPLSSPLHRTNIDCCRRRDARDSCGSPSRGSFVGTEDVAEDRLLLMSCSPIGEGIKLWV